MKKKSNPGATKRKRPRTSLNVRSNEEKEATHISQLYCNLKPLVTASALPYPTVFALQPYRRSDSSGYKCESNEEEEQSRSNEEKEATHISQLYCNLKPLVTASALPYPTVFALQPYRRSDSSGYKCESNEEEEQSRSNEEKEATHISQYTDDGSEGGLKGN
ncbi:hypothetical protein PRIPAC_93727 [Pristionchus pacificus]|uniref:Uncharacterized protein n=1 Tax=Pristionchus pacificus TaxID=54126 RepID=A0A2A6BBF2_PRIPA|nr:hypothetical protein PRIPAC_93727 [Pristionchus pacificus]|eukprot:PDM63208.1 hypothetical protein PRIPAC_50423 [Pristionchus pacificus]